MRRHIGYVLQMISDLVCETVLIVLDDKSCDSGVESRLENTDLLGDDDMSPLASAIDKKRRLGRRRMPGCQRLPAGCAHFHFCLCEVQFFE